MTILVSMVISLTTTPHDVRPPPAESQGDHGRLYNVEREVLRFHSRVYEASLALGTSPFGAHACCVTIVTLGLNVYLYVIIPKGFFPQQDTGRLNGNFIGDQDDLLPGDAGQDQKSRRNRSKGPGR